MDESLQRIMKTADGNNFAEYLRKTIKELDSAYTGLTKTEEIALEIKARELAIIKLGEIFDGLLQAKEESPKSFDRKEYAIDVDN